MMMDDLIIIIIHEILAADLFIIHEILAADLFMSDVQDTQDTIQAVDKCLLRAEVELLLRKRVM